MEFQAFDPRFNGLIIPPAALETLWTGGRWTEGPAWFGDSRTLLFSDIPNDRMLQWAEGLGVREFRSPANYSTGNTRDREGRLVTCEHRTRRVTRTEYDGSVTVLVDRFEGKRLNSPNDLCVSPIDGSIFFTDPAYGLTGTDKSPDRELDFTGVFRIAPDNSITLIGKYNAPNGIGVSPDGRRLYHTDRDIGWVVHELDAQGRSTSSRAFIDRTEQGFKATSGDGFKVDQAGNVWLSGDGISIVNPQGKRIGVIRISGPAANCELGADGYLYIAANKHLMRVKVKAGKLRA